MKHTTKEEIYAKRIQQTKVEREYIVRDALQRVPEQHNADKKSLHFKFTKNNLFK